MRIESLRARLRNGPVVLADGALGTMLIARCLASGCSPEAFGLEHPEILVEIARGYFEAGAELIQTNTFGASPLRLQVSGLDARLKEFNLQAVQAVREAVGNQAWVFASCGPSGRIMKPHGDTEPDAIRLSFAAQIQVLAQTEIDGVNFETFIDLAELELAVRAARAELPGRLVSATMTFQRGPRGYFTAMGTSVAQAAAQLARAGADIIGANCGQGIEQMIEVAREFRACSDLPTSIRPNAGLPVLAGEPQYPEGPEFMASRLPELLSAGVAIVGGCCGTTPEHIRAFRQVIARIQQGPRGS